MTAAQSSPEHGARECSPGPDGSCSICADEAFPGIVVSVDPARSTAQVRLEHEMATIALDLIAEETKPGDSVLVHLGFAIARSDRPFESGYRA